MKVFWWVILAIAFILFFRVILFTFWFIFLLAIILFLFILAAGYRGGKTG